MIDRDKNPWTPEDEREHYPSVMEWWAVESFLKTIEDDKRWSLKAVFTEWLNGKEKNGSLFNLTLFDIIKNKHYTCYLRNDKKKLETIKDKFDVRYNDNFIKGSYPNYEMSFNDEKNNIQIHLNYQAESLPRWIGQEVTDGWLPMGLGFYRYGFIPKCKISGEIIINNKNYHVDGKGYFEHVWGDIWYDNPLSNISNLKKTISVYSKLINWWTRNHKFRIPKSIKFCTENNPFGYDWAWALLDNGWVVYYGNILLWIMKGPAAGSLILSKDGKKYEEFCNISFKYNKTQLSKNFDFYYPIEIEINAEKEKEKIHLIFKKTSQSREYISRFTGRKYWKCFVICEAPGTVEGYYYDGEKKTKLTGICKIEPQRQVSVIGHNTLQIDFLKPPQGVGVSFDIDSHYFKKKIFTKIQLAPRPKIKFIFEKTKK